MWPSALGATARASGGRRGGWRLRWGPGRVSIARRRLDFAAGVGRRPEHDGEESTELLFSDAEYPYKPYRGGNNPQSINNAGFS